MIYTVILMDTDGCYNPIIRNIIIMRKEINLIIDIISDVLLNVRYVQYLNIFNI